METQIWQKQHGSFRGSKNMRKTLFAVCLITAAVLVTTICAGCGTSSSGGSPVSSSIVSSQNTGIWVTGVGKVTVIPDTAVLDLGVQAQASSVADAQSQATQAMTSIMTTLKKYNIADKDIATQNYSIYPVYSYTKGAQTISGYNVSNTLIVKIRNLSDVGNILSDVAAAGGNATSISSLSYTLDDPTQADASALKLAVTDAQAKAATLANSAGVKLGKASYINESGGYAPPTPISFTSSATAGSAPTIAVPVSPGSMDIQVSIQVVYSIN